MWSITFLGLGKMGLPMANNLANSGYKITCWNRTPAKLEHLSPVLAVNKDLNVAISGADIVISMLSDGSASKEVISRLRDKSLSSVKTWIEMASVLPQEAIDQASYLKKYSIEYFDAPVSGGTVAAKNGKLAIMVGGEENIFNNIKEIFNPLGRPVLVGPIGTGQLAKLANQAIVGITIGAVAEAVLLLERGGADADAVRDALSGGFADSTILQQHGRRMSKRNFEPGGSVKTQLKDLNNIQKVSKMLDLKLPMLDDVTKRYLKLANNSKNLEKDHSALFLELLKRNRIKD